jgi:hypothetical protein
LPSWFWNSIHYSRISFRCWFRIFFFTFLFYYSDLFNLNLLICEQKIRRKKKCWLLVYHIPAAKCSVFFSFSAHRLHELQLFTFVFCFYCPFFAVVNAFNMNKFIEKLCIVVSDLPRGTLFTDQRPPILNWFTAVWALCFLIN